MIVQSSSALCPSAQPFASLRGGRWSQTTCAGLHFICDQRAWQKAHSGLSPAMGPPRTARPSWEEQFDGCNLKLLQFYSLYFCCCLGLAHEWDFIGQFKYEMWNTRELHPLWSPGGRAPGITVHGAWQRVGGSKFSLSLWGYSCWMLWRLRGLREMRTMSLVFAHSALGWCFSGAAFGELLLGGGFLWCCHV